MIASAMSSELLSGSRNRLRNFFSFFVHAGSAALSPTPTWANHRGEFVSCSRARLDVNAFANTR